LSLKYRNFESTAGSDKVYYELFYNDYKEMDEHGLAEKIWGLLPDESSE
jgi:hypothetical protein